MGTPFKMKGSPFQRNFGIGSPIKHEPWAEAHKEKSAHSNTAEAHGATPTPPKPSPAKCPLVAAIIPALASAAAGAVVSGVVGAGKKKDAKKRAHIAKQAEAYKGLNIEA